MRVQAQGRIAVCSGREAFEGRGRWFVQLFDLEGEDVLVDQVSGELLGAHPLLLGRYLYTIESLPHQGRQALWLTRRELRFQ
jgi:hypothetical protein